VRARDETGYGGWSDTWKFLTDDTAPVSHVNPLPEYSTSVNLTVSWNGTDDSLGLDKYTIFIAEDDGPFGPWLGSTNRTTETYAGRDGHKYSFFSIAVDVDGNREAGKSSAEAWTTVDVTPPYSCVTTLAGFRIEKTFKVSWSGNDAASGVRSYDIYSAVDDENFRKWQAGTGNTSAIFSGEDGHEYVFYSVATDNAGNVQGKPGDKEMVRVKVDLTAPAISVHMGEPCYRAEPLFISSKTVIFLDSKDGCSGLNGTYYSIDGRPSRSYGAGIRESTPGHHNLTCWCMDRAGNKGETDPSWFFVDDDAPATTVSYIGPLVALAGNVFVTPETAISLSAMDFGCGVLGIEYKLDDLDYKQYKEPLKFTTAGQHTVDYRSSDKLGNSEPENTLKFTVDTAPPVTKGTASAVVSNRDITVLLTASDKDSGVCATFFRVVKEKATPGDFQRGTGLKIEAIEDGSADGNYTVEYYSVDIVGNNETANEMNVRIDTMALLELENKENETVGKGHYIIEGRTEPGSRVTVNGEPATVFSDGSFTAVIDLRPGKNELIVQATDMVGNTASKTLKATYTEPAAGTGLLITLVTFVVIAGSAGTGVLLWYKKKKK
jgi:hypothetical protein